MFNDEGEKICGRWYNLFGQEIMPPEMWRDECIEEDW